MTSPIVGSDMAPTDPATGLLVEILTAMIERQATRIADLDRRLQEVEWRLAGTLEVGRLVAGSIEVGDPCGPAATTITGGTLTVRHDGAERVVLAADGRLARLTLAAGGAEDARATLLAVGGDAAELTLNIGGPDEAATVSLASGFIGGPVAQCALSATGAQDIELAADGGSDVGAVPHLDGGASA